MFGIEDLSGTTHLADPLGLPSALRGAMARRCFSVGREMMAELHERWRHMYRNRSVPAAAVVAKPLEDREWSPEPLIRKLIQQQLQQMPLPMSPVSRGSGRVEMSLTLFSNDLRGFSMFFFFRDS